MRQAFIIIITLLLTVLASCSKESTAFQEVRIGETYLSKQGYTDIQPSRRQVCDSYDYSYRVAFRAIAPQQTTQQTYCVCWNSQSTIEIHKPE